MKMSILGYSVKYLRSIKNIDMYIYQTRRFKTFNSAAGNETLHSQITIVLLHTVL